MLGQYQQVLRTPGYLLPLALCMTAALPIGMVGLALLLTAHQRSGSLAQAGLAPAAFGLGNAAGLFVQGRLIDRFGQTRVLVPASLACATALLAAALPGWHGIAPPGLALAGCALVAGLAFPATIGSMRVLTTDLLADQSLRTSGYALLAVSFGLAMMVGPLVVSALVAVTGPAAAVLASALAVGAGGLGFAATPASRRWHAGAGHVPEGHIPGGHVPGRRGRQRLPAGLRTLLATNSALGFSGGVVAVALPAAALSQGAASAAGVGFAARSVGELAGGLAYGAIRWRSSSAGRLVCAVAAVAVASWCAATFTGSLAALFTVLLVGGTAGAVISTCCSALLDGLAPAGALTTSYTLMVGLGLVANAGGSAVAGVVAGWAGAGPTFAVAAAAVTGAALWAGLRRRTLAASSRADPEP